RRRRRGGPAEEARQGRAGLPDGGGEGRTEAPGPIGRRAARLLHKTPPTIEQPRVVQGGCTMRRLLLCLGLLCASSVQAAAPSPPPCDPDGTPLPTGARLRIGTARFRCAPAAWPYPLLALSADRERMALASASGEVRVCSALDGKEFVRVVEPGY